MTFSARDLRELVPLGVVASLEYLVRGGLEIEEVDVQQALFWSPSGEALVFWTGWSPDWFDVNHRDYGLPLRDDELEGDGAEVHRTWTRGRPALAAVRMATPSTQGPLRQCGPAVRICYDSHKFNRQRVLVGFKHAFEPGAVVRSEPGDPALWVVQGGGLRITEHGIEG